MFKFKVSNKPLTASKACISCQKCLLNQEVDNKQKAVKILPEKVIEVKNSKIIVKLISESEAGNLIRAVNRNTKLQYVVLLIQT